MNKKDIKNSILLFSNDNNEPNWIKDYRINAYKRIDDYCHPSFGPEIKLDVDLNCYLENRALPFHIEGDGFVACDIHTAFTKYKRLVEKYYSKLILSEENRYTVLNSVVFESGYFIYVFKDKKLDFPIFNKNINCEFSRNVLIVDENSELNIIDYCNSTSNFLCDCTEVFVEKGAKCRYVNLNMTGDHSTNVSVKRAQVEENASMDWINVLAGSNVFMGYPSSVLKGKKAFSTSVTLALSGGSKSINVGSKMIHVGEETNSIIKNVSYIGSNGELEIRNLVNIKNTALNSKSSVSYECLAGGNGSKYDNVPRYIIDNDSSNIDFKVQSKCKLNMDIMEFIESHFIDLSKLNKQYLQELIKKSN